MNIDRRRLLALAAGSISAGMAAAITPARAAPCYDPAALPLSQKNRRRSLGYQDVSTDPAKRCAACAFYTVGEADCGTCGLLNGQVNATAVCSSFAPRQ
jgi:hypothetical protein